MNNETYVDKNVGKADGFFYCGASTEEIETELPYIRDLVKTPHQLELSLIEGMDNIKGDERLTALAQEAKRCGINYMLRATNPNETNRVAADEATSLFNQLYQLPPFFGIGAEFLGAVVYEEEGKSVFRN